MQILLSRDKSSFYYQVQIGLEDEGVLLHFSSSSLANDLLTIFYYIVSLDHAKQLFHQAEKQLDPNARNILFYMYLRERKHHLALTPEKFFQRMRNAARSMEQVLHGIYQRNVNMKPLLLKLQRSDMGKGSLVFDLYSVRVLFDTMLFLVLREQRHLRHCKVCSAYFIRMKYQKGELCHYLDKNGSTCTNRLSIRNAETRIREDPLLFKYKQMYKRQYMRTERQICSKSSPLSPGLVPEFKAWSNTAKNLRKRYIRNEISAMEFHEGMDNLDYNLWEIN